MCLWVCSAGQGSQLHTHRCHRLFLCLPAPRLLSHHTGRSEPCSSSLRLGPGLTVPMLGTDITLHPPQPETWTCVIPANDHHFLSVLAHVLPPPSPPVTPLGHTFVFCWNDCNNLLINLSTWTLALAFPSCPHSHPHQICPPHRSKNTPKMQICSCHHFASLKSCGDLPLPSQYI